MIRPDGTGNHVILGPPAEQLDPDWSPDGSRIAYVQADGTGSEIWITDPQGTAPAPLLVDAPAELEGLFRDNPSWSRDGSVLAIVDVESGALSVAGELASVDGALHSFPRWSPNGSALVVSMDRFDGDEFLGGAVAGSRRTDGGWSAPEPVTEVVAGPWVDWHPTAGGALLARRRQPAPPAAAPGVLSRARRGGALPSAGRRHHPWS